jgi:hypothetical protein
MSNEVQSLQSAPDPYNFKDRDALKAVEQCATTGAPSAFSISQRGGHVELVASSRPKQEASSVQGATSNRALFVVVPTASASGGPITSQGVTTVAGEQVVMQQTKHQIPARGGGGKLMNAYSADLSEEKKALAYGVLQEAEWLEFTTNKVGEDKTDVRASNDPVEVGSRVGNAQLVRTSGRGKVDPTKTWSGTSLAGQSVVTPTLDLEGGWDAVVDTAYFACGKGDLQIAMEAVQTLGQTGWLEKRTKNGDHGNLAKHVVSNVLVRASHNLVTHMRGVATSDHSTGDAVKVPRAPEEVKQKATQCADEIQAALDGRVFEPEEGAVDVNAAIKLLHDALCRWVDVERKHTKEGVFLMTPSVCLAETCLLDAETVGMPDSARLKKMATEVAARMRGTETAFRWSKIVNAEPIENSSCFAVRVLTVVCAVVKENGGPGFKFDMLPPRGHVFKMSSGSVGLATTTMSVEAATIVAKFLPHTNVVTLDPFYPADLTQACTNVANAPFGGNSLKVDLNRLVRKNGVPVSEELLREFATVDTDGVTHWALPDPPKKVFVDPEGAKYGQAIPPSNAITWGGQTGMFSMNMPRRHGDGQQEASVFPGKAAIEQNLLACRDGYEFPEKDASPTHALYRVLSPAILDYAAESKECAQEVAAAFTEYSKGDALFRKVHKAEEKLAAAMAAAETVISEQGADWGEGKKEAVRASHVRKCKQDLAKEVVIYACMYSDTPPVAKEPAAEPEEPEEPDPAGQKRAPKGEPNGHRKKAK